MNMGPHEIVNGANGSVTWCQGPPFCPNCVQGARACARVGAPLRSIPVTTALLNAGSVVWYDGTVGQSWPALDTR